MTTSALRPLLLLVEDLDDARGFIAKPCLPADLVVQIAAFLKLQPEPDSANCRIEHR